MRRLVLDTNIVLSGLLWRGPPYSLPTHIGQNPGIQMFSSQCLSDELADVLIRPSPAKRLELINKTALEGLTDNLSAVTVLQPQPLARPVSRGAGLGVVGPGTGNRLGRQRFAGAETLGGHSDHHGSPGAATVGGGWLKKTDPTSKAPHGGRTATCPPADDAIRLALPATAR